MATDPAPFLSTIVVTSAGLVAIVGGLLVARFVSLDSDERSNRKVLADADARLASARRRAAEAHGDLVTWKAKDFFSEHEVLAAIGEGISELDQLRQFADCSLGDQDLGPLVAEVADEFDRARGVLADRVITSDNWELFRRGIPDLPPPRWPRVWRRVFAEVLDRQRAEEAARERAEAAERLRREGKPRPRLLSDAFAGLTPRISMNLNIPSAVLATPPSTAQRVTEARRYDELVAADQRAQQQVEDYQGERRRLQQAHEEIVRPDMRLWCGVIILVGFAGVGVVWPMFVMSRGPSDLASVRWLVYPFIAALAVLVLYIIVYLAQLTRRKPPTVNVPQGNQGP